jgi:hypothetical protein
MKLWEILANNNPGVGSALIILCAAMPETRGGGDLDLDANWHGPERTIPPHNVSPGPMPEEYPSVAHRTIGRWAGDPIALVGDYAEPDDLPEEYNADLIYTACGWENEDDKLNTINQMIDSDLHYEEIERARNMPIYTDITDDVCRVIEHELQGKFEGEGWRSFVPMQNTRG